VVPALLLDGAVTPRKCIWWAGVSSILVWCSFPAAFVAGSVTLVVALSLLRSLKALVHFASIRP